MYPAHRFLCSVLASFDEGLGLGLLHQGNFALVDGVLGLDTGFNIYNTLRYFILLYYILLYSTLVYHTILYSILLYSDLLYPNLVYSTVLYSTLCCYTLPVIV